MRLGGWADGAITRLGSDAREHFVLDPIATLKTDLGLSVQAVDHLASVREEGGACDGVSFLDDGVVLYSPTPRSKRQYFTIAHELGHWLVDQDEKLLDWIADQTDAGRVLESVCDAIAQRLLLPDDLVDSVVSTPVRARDIVELSDQSMASRQASAIAIASRLPKLGAAIIVDRVGRVVTSSSVHPDPESGWPVVYPWPGDVLPAGHPLASLTGDSITRKSFWRSPWGKREDFYLDAIQESGRIFAVLSAVDLWGLEALPSLDTRDWDRRPTGQFFCCGQQRTVRGWPCPDCGRQFCPTCGACECTARRRSEGECIVCHTLVGSHLLADGKCELCA